MIPTLASPGGGTHPLRFHEGMLRLTTTDKPWRGSAASSFRIARKAPPPSSWVRNYAPLPPPVNVTVEPSAIGVEHSVAVTWQSVHSMPSWMDRSRSASSTNTELAGASSRSRSVSAWHCWQTSRSDPDAVVPPMTNISRTAVTAGVASRERAPILHLTYPSCASPVATRSYGQTGSWFSNWVLKQRRCRTSTLGVLW